jgi:glyoxylase-like metal-dependent hydrolase (beta-lactamase superfamily II)
MARKSARLLRIAIALALTLFAIGVACRILRHSSSAPEIIGRVQRERNLFTDIYGARAGGGVILFDAGVDPEGGALDRLLGALGASRSDVVDVFLTHGHFDHVAASPLCGKAKIRVGAPDVEFMAQRVPYVGTAAVKTMRALFPVPPVHATDPLVGRVDVQLGEDKVIAIPTPGHTPGSYVFVFDKTLFAGDSMIIDGDKLGFAMGSFTVDPASNKKSIAALADALVGVDVQTVCTGHMGCTTPGHGASMLSKLMEEAKEAVAEK